MREFYPSDAETAPRAGDKSVAIARRPWYPRQGKSMTTGTKGARLSVKPGMAQPIWFCQPVEIELIVRVDKETGLPVVAALDQVERYLRWTA